MDDDGLERHSVEVDLRLTEDDDRCEAVAVMASPRGADGHGSPAATPRTPECR